MTYRLIAYYRNKQIACDISFPTREDMQHLLERLTHNRQVAIIKLIDHGMESVIHNINE